MGSPSSYSVPKTSSLSSKRRGSAIIIQAALKRNSKNKKREKKNTRRDSALLIQEAFKKNLYDKKKKNMDKKRRDSATLIAQFVKKNSGREKTKKSSNKSSSKVAVSPKSSSSTKATSPSSRQEAQRNPKQLTPRRNESKRRGSAMLIQQAWKNKRSASGRAITSTVAKFRKNYVHRTQKGMSVRHQISEKNIAPPLRRGCMGGDAPGPSRILKNLYLGNREDAMDLGVLQSLGVKYVVNATEQLKNFHEGTLSYLKVNVKDKEGVDLAPFFDQVTDFIASALDSDSGVLVHCIAGASRSVTFVLAYLMSPIGECLCLKDAFDFVKARRSCAHPNNSFLHQLAQYELTLHDGSSSITKARDKIWNNYELNTLRREVKGHLKGGKLKIDNRGCTVM